MCGVEVELLPVPLHHGGAELLRLAHGDPALYKRLHHPEVLHRALLLQKPGQKLFAGLIVWEY